MKKAVIFSCSLKDKQYSSTKAWADLMVERLSLQNIEGKVINLKDYDYEASTDKDELHVQLAQVYDADLIIFASPTNISHMTFSCQNLLNRFIHAHKNSINEKIDIFNNKFWEYCSFFGTDYVDDKSGRRKIKYYNESYSHWSKHHGHMMNTLTFIQHLGLKDTGVSTWSPDDPTGPRHNTMHEHDDVVQLCDRIVKTFTEKSKHIKKSVPACSLEKFLSLFESADENAFGRGMTLAEENINPESVKKHINYVHQTVSNLSHKCVAFMCMKERCTKLRLYDLAEMYYVEQFKIGKNPEYRISCSGNYRPNGY